MTALSLPARALGCAPLSSHLTPGALACALLLTGPALAAGDAPTAPTAPVPTLRDVVVTAVHDHSPVQVVANPKQPRQPVPASDAADYLKTIPGFSAIRSGGSNSDPVFRGQFGSRLPLLTNGTQLLGACPGRMDAPSSYISPETFDALTVVKGPQTVIWGPGASAGVVRFDRERPDFTEPGVRFSASLQGGSADRNDQNVDLQAGNAQMYVRVTANQSHGQDYQDGNGRRVPSAWDKWNADVALGFTPDADTLLELSAGAGDGEARYGGRGMDGTQFQRDSWGLRFEKTHLTPWLTKLEAQLYRNRADHVMDNFSLRTFAPGGSMASNVRRDTSGARLAATLQWQPDWQLVTGLDAMHSPHEKRAGSPSQHYSAKPWQRDAKFEGLGAFAELSWQAQADTRWVGGLRLDRAKAWRYTTASTTTGMGAMPAMPTMPTMPTTTGTDQRSRTALPSGFVRWEHTLAPQSALVYVGLGHVQRFPDYWELISPGNSAANAGNAFATLRPEKTTQLDLGAQWKGADWQLWTSAYVGVVRDYILFDYAAMKSAVRNVDARTAGFELGASQRLSTAWTAQGTLAYSWGRNSSDDRPLPQMPPLEARLGLDYAQGPWSAGGLWRLVAAQHRHANGQGNVVGRDLGASAGFGVLSLHAGYRINNHLKLAAGVDNLLDKNYAEHLNLAGNAGFGYPGGVRINEPGRTLWLRADMQF
ncbi:TonB-dependent copper receptor [Diaphorobacter sp.]|uniref:TonB-dependent copper receptor n=1 Tax=Diaphorobacter sp. TaxID=1934310 RepID=UPI003D132EBB